LAEIGRKSRGGSTVGVEGGDATDYGSTGEWTDEFWANVYEGEGGECDGGDKV